MPTDTDAEQDGPALLRQERTARGLSQQQLAGMARLSARTVRALEAGSIERPRSASLNGVCAALGLSGARRSAFLRAWGIAKEPRSVPPEQVVADPDRHAALVASVRRRMGAISLISVHNVSFVDPDGYIVAQQTDRVVTAARSAVRGTALAWVFDNPAQADSNRILNTQGCQVTEQIRLDPLTVFTELDFGRVLDVGEPHYYSYLRRVDPAQDVPDGSPTGSNERWRGRHVDLGGHADARVCVQEVRFAPGHRPTRCVQLTRRQIDAPGEIVRELDVDPSGVARLVIVDPGPGWNGIAWDW